MFCGFKPSFDQKFHSHVTANSHLNQDDDEDFFEGLRPSVTDENPFLDKKTENPFDNMF